MTPGKALRHTLLSLRELLISAVPVALLAIGLLVLAYLWLDPNPPKRVTLATGPAQSAYDEFGKRYQKALKPYGIDVVLLPSEGSSANLQLLRQGRADLGFVRERQRQSRRQRGKQHRVPRQPVRRTAVAVLSRGRDAQPPRRRGQRAAADAVLSTERRHDQAAACPS